MPFQRFISPAERRRCHLSRWRKLSDRYFKTSLENSKYHPQSFGDERIKTLKTNAYLLDGDEELKNASSQNDTPAASSEEAPVYQEFNQLPVVPSTQDTGVGTPQSSVAPVTPVAPAATESSSVTPTVPSE